jgi:hypothetical protein
MTDIERIEENTKIWWQLVSRSRFEPLSTRTLIKTANGDSYRSAPLKSAVMFIDGCYLEGVNRRSPGCVPLVGCEPWFTRPTCQWNIVTSVAEFPLLLAECVTLEKPLLASSHLSVCPPSCNKSASTAGIFMKFNTWGSFENLPRKLKFY